MTTADAQGPAGAARESERWLLRRGLTTLLEGTSVRRGATVRAAPALVVIFLAIMLAAVPDLTADPTVSLVIVAVVVLATWIGGNLVRRSPPFSRIDRIGWGERAVFVLAPMFAVLVSPHKADMLGDEVFTATQNRVFSALSVGILQLVVLTVVLVLVRYGVIALSVWLSREVLRSLSTSAAALSRALPLLLAFVTFSYYAAELWQSVGRLDTWAYAAPVALFVGLSGVFLAHRDHLDIRELATFESRQDWLDALRGTPWPAQTPSATEPTDATLAAAKPAPGDSAAAEPAAAEPAAAEPAAGEPVAAGPTDFPVTCPLGRHHERNLRLVATLSRLVAAGMVGLGVFVVFLILGTLTVNAELVKIWAGADPDVLFQWSTGRRTYSVTWENIRVSGFLAVFSAFYFAIVSATDATLRQGLADTAADTVREACALRLALLHDKA